MVPHRILTSTAFSLASAQANLLDKVNDSSQIIEVSRLTLSEVDVFYRFSDKFERTPMRGCASTHPIPRPTQEILTFRKAERFCLRRLFPRRWAKHGDIFLLERVKFQNEGCQFAWHSFWKKESDGVLNICVVIELFKICWSFAGEYRVLQLPLFYTSVRECHADSWYKKLVHGLHCRKEGCFFLSNMNAVWYQAVWKPPTWATKCV